MEKLPSTPTENKQSSELVIQRVDEQSTAIVIDATSPLPPDDELEPGIPPAPRPMGFIKRWVTKAVSWVKRLFGR